MPSNTNNKRVNNKRPKQKGRKSQTSKAMSLKSTLQLRGYGNASARTYETVQIAYDAPNKASTTLTIKPTITVKTMLYAIPRNIKIYVVSNETTFIRVFSNLGTVSNDSIIARSQMRVVGQVPQKIVLTITDKQLADAVGIIDSPTAIKDPSITIETSGRCLITGTAHFEFGTGIDFPSIPTIADVMQQSLQAT